ncbi:MAG TPA: hypothetical protein PK657_02955 [Legionella sp.]|nr:hypothetical protein [Legionella sp.]
MRYITGLILCCVLTSTSALDCPDMFKARLILKELSLSLNQDFCAREFNGEQLQWIRTTALPRMMTREFLGVTPPSNWREFVDEVMVACYHQGDLCTKAVQDQFGECVMARVPTLLFQLGPWMGENCIKLNEAVINKWQQRKPVVMQLINEYIQKFVPKN